MPPPVLTFGASLALVLAGGCAPVMSRLPVKGPPPELAAGSWAASAAQIEIVRFASAPDIELEGRFYPPGLDGMNRTGRASRGEATAIVWPEAATRNTTILFCHGVADNSASAMAQMFAWAGFRVFQFDYRGFGNSTKAELTATGLRDDTLAAVAYLRSRGDVDPARIVLAGHSLGAAMAISAAAELEAAGSPVAAVVANAGPANSRVAFEDRLPVVGFFMGGIDGPQPESQAARLLKTPLLITHPADDGILGLHHARRLFEASRDVGGRATLLTYPTGGHVSTYLSYPSYEAPVIGWLVQHLTPGAPKDWDKPKPPIDDRTMLKR